MLDMTVVGHDVGGVRRTDPKHDLGGLFILDERGFILKRGVIL
jgi:hypothetical protein